MNRSLKQWPVTELCIGNAHLMVEKTTPSMKDDSLSFFKHSLRLIHHARFSFSHSQYFLYKFPEDVDSVIIKVVSEKAYPCSVVSVQNIMVSPATVMSAPQHVRLQSSRIDRLWTCVILLSFISPKTQIITTYQITPMYLSGQSVFADTDER